MSYLIMEGGETHEIADQLPSIDCFRCGICCVRYRPRLGDDEITIIAGKLGMSHEAFRSRYIRPGAKPDELILDDGGEQCPFLAWDDTGDRAECTIHAFRPKACRSWQASLSRPECQEGLRKLKPEEGIILPRDLYSSQQEVHDLCSALRERGEVMSGSPYRDSDPDR
ncbi:MAG: YkgJ family cysteine cluster protein [Chloroflexota bacterium]